MPPRAAPPEQQQLLTVLQDDPQGTASFLGLLAGSVPIPEFFSAENMERLLAA